VKQLLVLSENSDGKGTVIQKECKCVTHAVYCKYLNISYQDTCALEVPHSSTHRVLL
jgi:hypothetical protein